MTIGPPSRPRVTVIVTFFNQERWVKEALDSVVVQTERDWQLIVTDDGSRDATRTNIEKWRSDHGSVGVLVAAEANAGLPAILNRAWEHVTGRFVVILNGDDWMEPDRVSSQADFLDAQPGSVGIVYSDLRVVDVEGVPTGVIVPHREEPMPEGNLLLRLIEKPLIGVGAVMFRREVVDSAGPWDESLAADDFDFLLRASAVGHEWRYLPMIAVNYRVNAGSLTNSRADELAYGRIVALKKHLGRSSALDHAIMKRIRGLVLALHKSGYNSDETRPMLRWLLRHEFTPELLRATAQSYLGRQHSRGRKPIR